MQAVGDMRRKEINYRESRGVRRRWHGIETIKKWWRQRCDEASGLT
jgi:hypothetical protein